MASAPTADRLPRVLVVEDELILALELEAALEAAGFAVVGPAASVAEGQGRLGAEPVDAAVLDVNIAGESVVPLAVTLAAAGIPFAVHTAYASASLDSPILEEAPRLAKPLDRGALPRVLHELLGGG
jgi:DNA-binding NtrC family response regulator